MRRGINYTLMTMVLVFFPVGASAIEYSKVADVYNQLKQEAKHERPVIEDTYIRVRIVKNFVKNFAKLDDENLGDAQVFDKGDVTRDQASEKLKRLAAKIVKIEGVYQQQVRPILLNNVKFKREDFGSLLNKTNLAQLFFKTKYNHRTSRPIGGIFHYKQDVSDSLFSKKMVNAGLLINFPELKDETWVKNALKMEIELITFLRLHRAYQDGIGVRKPKRKEPLPKTSAIVLPHVKQGLAASVVGASRAVMKVGGSEDSVQQQPLSSSERAMLVQKFVRSFTKLDADDAWEDFKANLNDVVEMYDQKIKRILVNNINLRRKDLGARANRGALIALFYPNRSNHKTGKPVSGQLRYEKDVSDSIFSTKMAEVGLLVEYPEREQDPVIQKALKMESELEVLFKEHRERIKYSGDTFLN